MVIVSPFSILSKSKYFGLDLGRSAVFLTADRLKPAAIMARSFMADAVWRASGEVIPVGAVLSLRNRASRGLRCFSLQQHIVRLHPYTSDIVNAKREKSLFQSPLVNFIVDIMTAH